MINFKTERVSFKNRANTINLMMMMKNTLN